MDKEIDGGEEGGWGKTRVDRVRKKAFSVQVNKNSNTNNYNNNTLNLKNTAQIITISL